MARETVGAHERIATWTARRATPSLRTGFMHAGPTELTSAIVAAAFARLPELDQSLSHLHRDDLPEALHRGDVDAGFLWGRTASTGCGRRS